MSLRDCKFLLGCVVVFCMVFAVIATVANALVVSFIAQLFAAGDLIAFLVIEFLEMSDE